MTATRRAWFLVHPKGIVVGRDARGALRLPTDAEVAALGPEAVGAPLDAGRLGEREAIAASIDPNAPLPPPLMVLPLRDLYGSPIEEGADSARDPFWLAACATQLVEWATTHRFCGRCASPTERVPDERCMRCPACGHVAYPRIAPAIIVLVRRGDEALLARNARAPGGFFSTLAGFVEIGESLEETLAREVREEVGIDVKNVRYFGSQPWPFPHSLMLAFVADWAGGDIEVDGKEILEARWFRADALPPIPPRISIARQLIDAWLADVAAK